MAKHNELKLLFTGSEIDTEVLKQILDDNQIPALIRNDINSSKAAGFGVNAGSEARVFVTEDFFAKANALLKEFLNSFNQE